MADVRPFVCVRPAADAASQVAALPYDVYSRKEACEAVKGHPLSFLNIDRAETQFADDVDTYDPRVYAKAKEMLEAEIADGTFVTDEGENYYLYRLTMDGRSQTGIVACCSIDDYVNGVIKKHENTREEKELDRIRHVDITGAHTGPIFLAYRRNETLAQIMADVMTEAPLYDFVSEDRQPGNGRGDPGGFRENPKHLYRGRASPGGIGGEGRAEAAGGEPGIHGTGGV